MSRRGARQRGDARGGLKSGDKVFVWGLKAQPGRGERTLGITDTLAAAGMTVDYLEIDDATNEDASAGVPIFTGMASANPDLKAIFIDHGNLTSTIPTYMKAANLTAGSVYAAGFDLSPATVQGIKDGYVRPGHRPAAVPPGFRGHRQLCLSQEVRFQRPVHQHRRRFRRQDQHRRDRAARDQQIR